EDAEKIKLFVSHYKEPARQQSTEEKTGKQAREEALKEDALDISDLKINDLKTISRKFVVEGIIRPRLREIFDLVALEIKKSGYAGLLPAGVVLCGGAASTIGMSDTIRDSLRVPVRIATPKGATVLIEEVTSPAFAASVGTIIHGAKVGGESRRPIGIGVGGIGSRFLNWIKNFMP